MADGVFHLQAPLLTVVEAAPCCVTLTVDFEVRTRSAYKVKEGYVPLPFRGFPPRYFRQATATITTHIEGSRSYTTESPPGTFPYALNPANGNPEGTADCTYTFTAGVFPSLAEGAWVVEVEAEMAELHPLASQTPATFNGTTDFGLPLEGSDICISLHEAMSGNSKPARTGFTFYDGGNSMDAADQTVGACVTYAFNPGQENGTTAGVAHPGLPEEYEWEESYTAFATIDFCDEYLTAEIIEEAMTEALASEWGEWTDDFQMDPDLDRGTSIRLDGDETNVSVAYAQVRFSHNLPCDEPGIRIRYTLRTYYLDTTTTDTVVTVDNPGDTPQEIPLPDMEVAYAVLVMSATIERIE